MVHSCDAKLNFHSSIITPVFSVTWSFRNQSNMLIYCSKKESILLQPCGCSVYSAVLRLSVSALPRENHPIGSCRLIVPVSWLVYRTLKVTTSLPQEQCHLAILWSEQLVLYSAEFWWEVVFRELWDCEYFVCFVFGCIKDILVYLTHLPVWHWFLDCLLNLFFAWLCK